MNILYCSTLALAVGLCGVFAAVGAAPSTQPSFPEPSALPSQTALPDPLVMLDGRRVASRDQWFKERRPELKALFQHYMYGAIPPKPDHVRVTNLGEYHDFLAGKATLKLLRLEMGPARAPQIDLMLIVPNERPGPEQNDERHRAAKKDRSRARARSGRSDGTGSFSGRRGRSGGQ